MQELLRDTIGWDLLNWSRALPFWEAGLVDRDPATTRVLALGERRGGVSLWFALKGYRVICSDIEPPGARTRELHRAYGVQDRIDYQCIDVFRVPYGEAFDVVVCKSVIGGVKLVYKDASTRTLSGQCQAMSEIHRVLKPGGLWLGAENMRGTPIHHKAREWALGGKVDWRHLSPSEWDPLLRPFKRYDIDYFGVVPTSSSSRSVNRLAYWTNLCLNRAIPEGWKYIAFLRAEK